MNKVLSCLLIVSISYSFVNAKIQEEKREIFINENKVESCPKSMSYFKEHNRVKICKSNRIKNGIVLNYKNYNTTIFPEKLPLCHDYKFSKNKKTLFRIKDTIEDGNITNGRDTIVFSCKKQEEIFIGFIDRKIINEKIK